MKVIDSRLFRPPYGKLSSFQNKQLMAPRFQLLTVMYSILSADFDEKLTPEKCLENVVLQAGKGDIVVFHDSRKAMQNMMHALPGTLEYFSKEGYRFEKIVPVGAAAVEP